jgi:hypothetical protein
MVREKILSICVAAALVIGPLLFVVPDGQGLELPMDRDLSKAHSSFWGEDGGDSSGWSVAGVGDVNGDGYDDILIGAYGDDDRGTNAGQTYLILGKASGWARDTDLSAASASFLGEGDSDSSGNSVAGAGDVNGDGYDDILIGAYYDGDGGMGAGQTYLVFGRAAGWEMRTYLSAASASFWGENGGDASGISVAGAGDVNGDGYDDILIGAYQDDDGGSEAGQTYLILGKASGWAMDTKLSAASASFWGEHANDYSGCYVAGAGDVNGDGYDDILIGARQNGDGGAEAGQTYLILGNASGWTMDTNLSAASASFWGENAYDKSGYSVAGAGDVNGDGYDDILIGAYGNNDGGSTAGQTYLILGKATGWAMDTYLSAASASFWGEDAGDASGIRVAGTGDVNGDGYHDFLIGAILDEDGGYRAGQTYLMLGRCSGWAMDTDLSAASTSFVGENADDKSGCSVAGAGDVNGDGYDDIIIGAYDNDEGGGGAGQTYIIMPFSKPPAPNNLEAKLSPTQRVIYLTWDSAGPWKENLVGYRLYVSTDGTNFKEAVFRLPSDRFYTDTNVIYGRTYYYVAVTEDETGALSGRTAMVSLVCDRDTDSDGIGDLTDWDDDGDGMPDAQDAFPLNSTEKLDTDLDGIGNNADTDDDNDGIPDASDPEPLNSFVPNWNDIKFMNTTLQNNFLSVLNNISRLYSSLDITPVISGIAGMNASLQNNITILLGNMAGMNSSLRENITTVLTGITGMNSTFRAELLGMNASLAAHIADVATTVDDMASVVADISSDLSSMRAYIEGMNGSIAVELSGLEVRLGADIAALDIALEAVNASIQSELLGLGDDIAAFRTEMTGDLAAIMARLDRNNQTQNENYNRLQSLVNDINSTSLADIKNQLAALKSDSDLKETGLNAKLDDFKNKTLTRLENLTGLMTMLDDIRSLTSDVKNLQTQVNGVKDQQTSTKKQVEALAPPSWGSMVLVIMVLALSIVLLLMSRGKKHEPVRP